MTGTPGRIALDALDTVLAGKPARDEHAMTHATICLATFRDAMIEGHRSAPPTPEARTRLAHLNSVLSVVLAGHFPLGNTPWSELEKARGWLADLVRDCEPSLAGRGACNPVTPGQRVARKRLN